MEIRAAGAFFLALVAMLLAGATAALFSDSPSAAEWMATIAAAAAMAQAVTAAIMLRGLSHAKEQAEAAQRSVKIVQENSERQLRAYIDVEALDIDLIASPTVVTIVRNAGQTPARQVRATTEWSWSSPVEVESTPIPALAVQTSTRDVAAGGTFTLRRRTDPNFAAEIAKGEKVLVVTGRIEYFDVFGERRTTTFRRWTGRSHIDRRLRTCATGNTCD